MKSPNEMLTFKERDGLALALLRVQSALLEAQRHAGSRDSEARRWLVASLESAATLSEQAAEAMRVALYPDLYAPDEDEATFDPMEPGGTSVWTPGGPQ